MNMIFLKQQNLCLIYGDKFSLVKIELYIWTSILNLHGVTFFFLLKIKIMFFY